MLDTDKIYKEFFLGAIALVILLIVLTPAYFYDWITMTFFIKVVTIFFVLPIAYVFIDLKFPKEILVVFGIGGCLFFIYSFMFNLSFKEMIVPVLETIIEIVFISVIILFFHKKIKERVPP